MKVTNYLMHADMQGVKLSDWVLAHRNKINLILSTEGALRVRGLNICSTRQFGKLLSTLFDGDLLPYNHRSSPRTELKGNVYTATEYHSGQLIVQHNEQAYTNIWPMRIGFLCMQPSEKGGETPIADSRIIYQKIPRAIRDRFEEKGVMYVRNFSDIDLPWQEVYNTHDRAEVESYCLEHAIQFEWLANGQLRTKQVLPAVVKHPVTKELIWFNQAHLFHISALNKDVGEELLLSRGQENVPRNCYYGDGSEIGAKSIQVIRDIYEQYKICFSWLQGDLLLLDNMLFSHGRMPFIGERQVFVGMAKPYSVGTNLE